MANLTLTQRSGVAIVYRKDVWTLHSSFALFQVQRRSIGAILCDGEEQRWLVIVNHFTSDLHLQTMLWRTLQEVRQAFASLPVIMILEHKSILVPEWDSTKAFATRHCTKEAQNILTTREHAKVHMLSLGYSTCGVKYTPTPKAWMKWAPPGNIAALEGLST